MNIDRPTSMGNPILEQFRFKDVVTGQHGLTDDATGLASQGKRRPPDRFIAFQSTASLVGAMVLQMIPYTHGLSLKFILNSFAFLDDVSLASKRKPPEQLDCRAFFVESFT